MSSLKSYLARLEACLGSLPLNARRDVLEELRGHLEDRAAALQAGGLEKEVSMSEAIESFGEAREVGAALRDVHGRGSWSEALAGMMPFLAFGLMTVLCEVLPRPNPVRWPWGSVACYVVLLIGFGVGWMKGFPRWSYPYGGSVLVFTWWWMGIPAQNLWAYGIWILKRYNELLGWRAWIPLLVLSVIALLLTRSVRPLLQLVTGIWHDWTRLSFGLYGIMPMVVYVGFDEVSAPYTAPCLAASAVILTVGALAYMRSTRTPQRALALLMGMTLALGVGTAANAIYWDGRLEPWMRGEPDRWYEIVGRNAIGGAVLVALMFVPALLSLLRRPGKSMRAG